MILSLRVRCMAGADVKDAIREAKIISRMLGMGIELSFNGVNLYIMDTSDVEKKYEEYAYEVRRTSNEIYD